MKITLVYVPHIASFVCSTIQSVNRMNELLFFPLIKDGMKCYSKEQINLLITTLGENESVEFVK